MTAAPLLRRGFPLLALLPLAAACAGGGPPLHRDRPAARSTPRTPAASAPRAGASEPAARREAEADREAASRAASGTPVRVGLHWDETPAVLETLRTWTIAAGGGAARSAPGGTLRARADGGLVRVVGERDEVVASSEGMVRLAPSPGSLVTVDGRRYRGTLTLSARSDSLFVVEELALEDYLRGVVPAEIGRLPAASRAAAAAQAIAARTYTAAKLGQYTSLPFDLFASVQDQVYDGFDGEDPLASAAIEETAGLVLAAGDGLAQTYYSSTCGGRRADIAVVWPHKEAVDYLRGGQDGTGAQAWCRESPHFAWREAWTGARLAELVRRHLPGEARVDASTIAGALTDLVVRRDEKTGRLREVEYRWKGGRAVVPGDRNRWILRRPDGSILRSVAVRLEVEREGGRVTRVVATGGGNGHGVGLCQTGAIARARAGESFAEILEAYYPGTKIRPLEDGDFPS